ncbi:MAG: FAD-dependent oxidoreductase [Ginsengibacter sp.]
MHLTGGYPFWLINDGLLYYYPKLLKDTEVNTVIIGGGISGALTAYYLTNAGIDCMLVDGRSIGLGSTCASTSLLQYELDTPLHILKEKIGNQAATRAYQLCGNAIDKLVKIMNDVKFPDYEKTGSLFFSAHNNEQAFMQKEFDARKKAGFNVTLLGKDDLKKEYGLKASSAILSEEGCTANAYTLTHALLQHSIKRGLLVFDRTFIKKIHYNKSTELQTAENYTIRAKRIINSTGYEVIKFIPKGMVDFYCTYAAVSEQAEGENQPWKGNVMMWNTDDPYLYIRHTRNNRIIIGGRDERFSNAVTREAILEKKSRQLQKDFNKAMPDIVFKKEFTWSGTFGKTKDSLPYIGAYKKTPNTFYALGFGGNGITFSLIAAEILRDALCGKNNPDSELFSFNR